MHSRRLEVSAGRVPSRLAGKDPVRINSEHRYVAMASHLAQNLRRSTKSDQKKKIDESGTRQLTEPLAFYRGRDQGE